MTMGFSYSAGALQAFLVRERLHMSNVQCWKNYSTSYELAQKTQKYTPELEQLLKACNSGVPVSGADGMLYAFDEDFPVVNPHVPENERPFLLYYRGDISLLRDLNKNVAVIGTLEPDEITVERERHIVKCLVEKGMHIVSGLALGCDTVAHLACMEAGGKTIAILPSQLDKVSPAKNRELGEKIVKNGGLLLTEYAQGAASRGEAIKRYPERDRMQAMFSKAVIMIASYRRGEGDSGSRYAMESAKKYHIGRYVMFDRGADSENPMFGLNQELLGKEPDVKVLCHSTVEALAREQDPKLVQKMVTEQIRIDVN